MAAPNSCPPHDRLRQLLASDSAGGEQAELIAHLDHCATCQRALEQLSGANPAVLDAVATLRLTPYQREAPLQRVLDSIVHDRTPAIRYRDYHATSWIKSLLRPAPGESLGMLGDFEITEVLGHGGMGLVLKAFDAALHRWVAIKVLGPNLADDNRSRQRFAREAQAAAAVHHANVVAIHSVSEVNGLPYFVMEFIAGGSLQDYLDGHGPPEWTTVARLGAEIAAGLAAAHAEGLIHRDIKPSNILLQPDPAHPDLGIAKIGDFGLARAADEARLTQSGIVPGTPMYMAPEQAQSGELDPRADLFSLGSVLFTLATGREPFPGETPMAVLRQVCEARPQPVRDLNPAIPSWLAAVIDRLHGKHPSDRFRTASEVADLLRYNLAHPDRPRPVSSPLSRRRSRRQRRHIVLASAIAGLLLLAGWLWQVGPPWARRHDPSADVPDDAVALRATLAGHTGPVWSVAFAPDGKTVATGSDDATLRLWDAATGEENAVVSGHNRAVFSVTYAHSGNFLLSGDSDGALHVWNAATFKEQASLPHQGGNARRVALSPDDKTVAVGSGSQGVELWNIESRKARLTLGGGLGTIMAIAFAPNGKVLAAGDASGHIQFWDPATGAEGAQLRGDPLGLRGLAFTPDSQVLASAGTGDKDVKFWKMANLEMFAGLSGFENSVQTIALAPNGSFFTAAWRDGTVKIWNYPSLHLLATLQAHQGNILSMAFSPDGATLATAGEDRLGKLWDLSGLNKAER